MTALPNNVQTIESVRPTASVVLVDPATATRWLEWNTNNRKIRKQLMAAYARDMAAGDWQLAGDPIRFAADGTLLDGQHRLYALIAAGVTLPMLVVRGLDPASQAVMDIGGKRFPADALRLRGVPGDTKDIAAIARSVLMYYTRNKPTQAQIVQLAEEDWDGFAEASRLGKTVTNAGLRGGSVFGCAAYLLSQVNPAATEEFMSSLATGVGLEKGSPILHLRNKFMHGAPATARDASSLRHNLAWIFKAWNHWRDGSSIHLLRMASTDAYPVPR